MQARDISAQNLTSEPLIPGSVRTAGRVKQTLYRAFSNAVDGSEQAELRPNDKTA